MRTNYARSRPWLIAAGALALIFVVITSHSCQYVRSVLTWRQHKDVSFQGRIIHLPKGWTVDDQSAHAIWLAEPTLFSPSPNVLFVAKVGDGKKAEETLAIWKGDHVRIAASVKGSFPEVAVGFLAMPESADLQCFEERFSRNLVQRSCISRDAVWRLDFFGQSTSLRDMQQMISQFMNDPGTNP